jgi:uncharacterized UPF0160 family protein
MAILLLKMIPEFSDLEILRTDDPSIYKSCRFRISCGKIYDHSAFSYIAVSNLEYPGFPSTMSVAGLIFYHYGEEALAARLAPLEIKDSNDTKFVLRIIYSNLIEDLDAGRECDIRRCAAILEPVEDTDPIIKQEAFKLLLDFIEEQLDQKISWIAKKLLSGREIVRRAVQERKRIIPTGEIVYIPHYVPIELHKDLISGDEGKKHVIRYIVMPRAVGDIGVYALSWRPGFRRLKYAGLRDDHLAGVLQGITGQGWIHPLGTVGAWLTIQNAIEYLKQTLKQPDKSGVPNS